MSVRVKVSAKKVVICSGNGKHQTLQLASDYVPTVPTSEACEACCAAIEFEHITLVHSTATGNIETVHEQQHQHHQQQQQHAPATGQG
jgi:hypothetical protein